MKHDDVIRSQSLKRRRLNDVFDGNEELNGVFFFSLPKLLEASLMYVLPSLKHLLHGFPHRLTVVTRNIT